MENKLRNKRLSKNMKKWLKELYEEAAKEHCIDASSCTLFAGNVKSKAYASELINESIEHRMFANMLKYLASEIKEG